MLNPDLSRYCLRAVLILTVALLQHGCAGTNGLHTPAAPPSVPLTPSWQYGNASYGTLTVDADEAGDDANNENDDADALQVRELDVHVTVEGRIARTEVRQVFFNPRRRVAGGTYTLDLPAGAAITRLAMDVNGVITEGEIVERHRARAIYDRLTRRVIDPAIMEWQHDNRFETSIFPIPAEGTKTVIVEWEQVLPATPRGPIYRLQLPDMETEGPDADLQTIDQFDFRLESAEEIADTYGYPLKRETSGTNTTLTLSRADFAPRGALQVRLEPIAGDDIRFSRRTFVQASDGAASGRPDETFFLADLELDLRNARAPAAPDHLILLVDTSRSMGPAMFQAFELAAYLARFLYPDAKRVSVLRGDIFTKVCLNRVEPHDLLDFSSCYEDLEPDGASDLSHILRKAGELVRPGESTAAVLLSDGEPTAGLRALPMLVALADDMTLHTVGLGSDPNPSFLREFSNQTGGLYRPVPPGAAASEAAGWLRRELARPELSNVRVEVTQGEVQGLTPTRVQALRQGERLDLVGKWISGPVTLQVTGTLGEQEWRRTVEFDRPPDFPEDPTLSRFWARRWIDHLERKQTEAHDFVVELALDYGVISRWTSFLVLEGEDAYERWEIERRREAERLERTGGKPPERVPAPRRGDKDGDGIPDRVDQCPDEAEVYNGFQDQDGCPDNKQRARERFYNFDSSAKESSEKSVVVSSSSSESKERPAPRKLLLQFRRDQLRDYEKQQLASFAAGAVANNADLVAIETYLPEDPSDEVIARSKENLQTLIRALRRAGLSADQIRAMKSGETLIAEEHQRRNAPYRRALFHIYVVEDDRAVNLQLKPELLVERLSARDELSQVEKRTLIDALLAVGSTSQARQRLDGILQTHPVTSVEVADAFWKTKNVRKAFPQLTLDTAVAAMKAWEDELRSPWRGGLVTLFRLAHENQLMEQYQKQLVAEAVLLRENRAGNVLAYLADNDADVARDYAQRFFPDRPAARFWLMTEHNGIFSDLILQALRDLTEERSADIRPLIAARNSTQGEELQEVESMLEEHCRDGRTSVKTCSPLLDSLDASHTREDLVRARLAFLHEEREGELYYDEQLLSEQLRLLEETGASGEERLRIESGLSESISSGQANREQREHYAKWTVKLAELAPERACQQLDILLAVNERRWRGLRHLNAVTSALLDAGLGQREVVQCALDAMTLSYVTRPRAVVLLVGEGVNELRGRFIIDNDGQEQQTMGLNRGGSRGLTELTLSRVDARIYWIDQEMKDHLQLQFGFYGRSGLAVGKLTVMSWPGTDRGKGKEEHFMFLGKQGQRRTPDIVIDIPE